MSRCKHDYVVVEVRKIGSRIYITYECMYCGAQFIDTEYDL